MTAPTRPESALTDPEGHTHDGRYHTHISGQIPHNHTPTIPYRIPARTKRIIAGIAGLILGAIAQWGPIIRTNGRGYSVAQIHGICTSGLGQLAQAIDTRVTTQCDAATAGYGLLWLIILISAGVTMWAVLSPAPGRHAPP
jgi:hypothetical protein